VGVELGKELANLYLEEINSKQVNDHDSSTRLLLNYFIQKQKNSLHVEGKPKFYKILVFYLLLF
jgi:hypothetical protein